ncbi:MAG: tetratricopeptide repeat protein [Anaerolineae bacterium]
MANTTLRALTNQAERLVRMGVCEETIALCQAILRRYPRYARCYRILGQAYMGLAEYEEAARLFRRALGVDPEDALAYAGLGVIFEERGLLDEAIWQLQRAYELSPGREVLRRELTRLYERRGVPVRVQMTRAALARIYARGGLWNKAIAELRELLLREPYRLDLRASLARTLWRARRRREAADAAMGIIDQAPNCLVALLILGTWWCQEGRDPEGRALLLAAQELDPENREAARLLGKDSLLAVRTAPMETAASPALEPDDLGEDDTEPAVATRPEPLVQYAEAEPAEGEAAGDDLPAVEEHIASVSVTSLREFMVSLDNTLPAETEQPPVNEEVVNTYPAAEVEPVETEPMAGDEPSECPEGGGELISPLLSPVAVLRRRVDAAPDDQQAHLALARALVEAGDLAEALSVYDKLAVPASGLLDTVLADLEMVALSHPRYRALRELMGDAYARAGRFQEAMAMYRWLLAADDVEHLAGGEV